MSRRYMLSVVVIAAAILVLSIALRSDAQAPNTQTAGGGVFSQIKVGTAVKVQLRGDVSGIAFTERSSTGFLLTKEGKVTAVHENWLVLESGTVTSFIPLSSVAVIDAMK